MSSPHPNGLLRPLYIAATIIASLNAILTLVKILMDYSRGAADLLDPYMAVFWGAAALGLYLLYRGEKASLNV